jgi:hypothetical protein
MNTDTSSFLIAEAQLELDHVRRFRSCPPSFSLKRLFQPQGKKAKGEQNQDPR